MESERFLDLCGQLADDQDLESKLSACDSVEDVVSVFNDYGVNKEEFDELKEFYHQYEAAQEDLNGGFDLCLGIGFGSSAACSGKGADGGNGPTTGGGAFGCEGVGFGAGANVPKAAIDAVASVPKKIGRGIANLTRKC